MSTDDQLPTGWAWARLDEVCEKIQDGTHFSPKNQLSEGKYRYITAKNVRPNGLDLTDVTYLTEEDHREINQRCDPRPGDVLLVKDGVNTGDAAVNTLDEEISLLSSVCMLRPKAEILNNHFLRYYLLSPSGSSLLTGKMSGTAIKRIILRLIKETPIPLAPLQEQVRIVSEVEEVLPALDAGVAALLRVRANLKRYRAAILKAAVTGELTAEWRADHPQTEPATKLLDRILAERRRKWEEEQLAKYEATGKAPPKSWQEKYSLPSEPNLIALPELPTTWCWASFDQCAFEVTVGHVGPMKDRYVDSGIPFLRSQNVRPMRFDEEGLRYIPDDFHNQLSKSRLFGGELLVVRSGNIGEACVYPKDEPEANCADLVITRLVPYVLPAYGAIFVNSPFGKYLVGGRRTGSALSHFNVGAMKTSPFSLPPLDEQKAVVAEVERQLSGIDATVKYIDANLKRSERLRQSILNEAFAGRLVPQDPNDEPAGVLLERLRLGVAESSGRSRCRSSPSKSTSSFDREGRSP